ncbi:MAG: hypothetical protein K0U45_10415 [Alphaproteobacteria bacterium]|nr:hypothetical protein [Alphaproteobacteria bacterium]
MKKSHIAFIVFIVTIIGLFPMPYGYYTFLKIIVFLGGLYYIADLLKNDNSVFVCIFTLLVILHNPIIPVKLGSKEAWIVINIITILCFFIQSDNKLADKIKRKLFKSEG